jgi:hypothetical protein
MRTLLYIFVVSGLMSCSNHPKKYKDLTDRDYQHDSASVNGQKVFYKTATSENEPQKFSELNKEDLEFMNNCRSYADSLIQLNFPDRSIKDYSAELLDLMINLYNANKIKCSQNAFVNSVGVAFGDYLVNKLNMKWTVVEDKYGRDYGTTIKDIALTNFPLNSVLKAIEQKRDSSLLSIYLINIKSITDLTSEKIKN